MMKNVLMITYLFPPAGGTGAVRVTKFAKYLPAFGWKPIVLTSYDTGISLDLSALEDLHEDVCVHRVSGLMPEQRAKQYETSLGNGNEPQKGATLTNNKIKTKLQGWLKLFIKDYLLIPDSAVLWVPTAILKGLSLINQYDIQAIYANGGPWSVHLVGYALKKLTGKPLVLDFRDPWAAGSGWSSKWRARVEGYLERKVVENASKVITVTPPILHDFVKRYPKSNGNFVLITNGFDEMDFKQRCDSQVSKRNNVNEVFSIIYTGTIKGTSASPRHFLLAVKRLIEASVIDKNQIQVRFVGKTYKDSYGKDLCEYVKDYKLEKIVRFDGFIPRNEVARIQTEADVLLLFINQSPVEGGPLSGKIYEYTAARRPVLALVPRNSAAIVNYLKSTGVGIWAAMDDIDDIASKVKLLYETKGSFLRRNEQEIAKYSRKVLTKQLAHVLDACVR